MCRSRREGHRRSRAGVGADRRRRGDTRVRRASARLRGRVLAWAPASPTSTCTPPYGCGAPATGDRPIRPAARARPSTVCRLNPATAPGSPRGHRPARSARVAAGNPRLILGKERPHPGAQLRTTDADGLRVTGLLTNTAPGRPGRELADLELRHRRHARAERSARRRTPAWPTWPSTVSARTGSGSPSPPWPGRALCSRTAQARPPGSRSRDDPSVSCGWSAGLEVRADGAADGLRHAYAVGGRAQQQGAFHLRVEPYRLH